MATGSRSLPAADAASSASRWRGLGRGVNRGANRATVISRLPPLPGTLSTSNPAAASPSRTVRATDQVAAVASGAAIRAIALNRRGSHICGLRAGAKPSRKKASTLATSWGSQSPTSPKASSSCTRPDSKLSRCRLQVSGGQAATSWDASGARGSSRGSEVEVVARQRPGLDRDEVQPGRALRIVPPGLPGRQEVVAEAEAGLEHDELLATAPARRQRVAGEEDLAGLGQGALARVVEVAELGRARQPVGIALEPAGDDRPGLHAAAGSASMRRRRPRAGGRARQVRPR